MIASLSTPSTTHTHCCVGYSPSIISSLLLPRSSSASQASQPVTHITANPYTYAAPQPASLTAAQPFHARSTAVQMAAQDLRQRNPDSITSGVRCRHLDQQQPEEFLGPHGFLRYHSLGTHKMCGYYFPAQDAKGVVLLVHGQGSYFIFDYLKNRGVGKHKTYAGSWVEALNKAGYSCAGIDNRGCGRSGGLFGYVDSHTDWVDDLLAFTQSLQHTDVPGFSGLPTFLLGASLGGCISLLAALKQPELFSGLMLLAPMISLDKVKQRGLNPILIPLAALLNRIIPTWPMAKTPKNDMFPELQADFDSDLCTYKYDTRIRVGVECLRACDSLAQHMQQLALPLLVFHSTADTLTDPDGSKMLVGAVKSQDKTLRLLNDFWHVLTKEEGNEKLLKECIAWLDAKKKKA